jgi:membrane protein
MAEMGVPGIAQTATGLREQGKTFLRDVAETLRKADVPGLAAQVAYSFIFAMPSILLIVTLVAGQIDQRTGFAITDEVRDAIITTMPTDVQPVMTGLLDDAMTRARAGPTTLSAIVSILVALLVAGNGLSELSNACCTAAGIEDTRAAWLRRVIFTVASLLIAAILVGAFTLFIWGGDLMAALGTRFGTAETWVSGWHRLQVPVLFLLVFLGVTLLYMTGTRHYVFWHVAPGALIATLLWLAAVKSFQFYLQIANPATAYGAASSTLVFLVFLYVSAIVLIIGGMIAAVIAREVREGTILRSALALRLWRNRPIVDTEHDRDGRV